MSSRTQVAMAERIKKLGHCNGIWCSASIAKKQPNGCPLWNGENSCAVEEVSPEAFTAAAEKWLYRHP